MQELPAHVVVFGNEKGGSGKSTAAVHVAVALMQQGFKVGAIDLDSRQKSLARYIENREEWCRRNNLKLALPEVRVIARSARPVVADAQTEEQEHFSEALSALRQACDVVIIDAPGSDTYLSRLGHQLADTLVTPMNDSFVDFDLFAKIDPDTFRILTPSLYAELVWESRKRRAMSDRSTIDWVVMRNRVASLDAKNKRRVGEVLDALSKRIGFRIAPGLSERVIFRELFPFGLTLLDLGSDGQKLTMSHLAARQEVRDLVAALNLPALNERRSPYARPGLETRFVAAE
ncbi:MAG: AAA family ATPase [Alphaproteobacteria bacterium]|nr:AAA family ATPase [Alphaproteobacteria bacterium]